jgi:serine/threonine protein kinase
MALECINQINLARKKSFSSFFGNIDPEALNLLQHLLIFNPNLRYTAEQALEHPYLRDFHDGEEEIEYNGTIKIPIDDNIKYSIKEYREALYKEISNQKYNKKPEKISITLLNNQDSNLAKQRDGSLCEKEKAEDYKHREKRTYTEYSRVDDLQRFIKRDSRELSRKEDNSKENVYHPGKEARPFKQTVNAEKSNWGRHLQKSID